VRGRRQTVREGVDVRVIVSNDGFADWVLAYGSDCTAESCLPNDDEPGERQAQALAATTRLVEMWREERERG
jgi:hypothetical protein